MGECPVRLLSMQNDCGRGTDWILLFRFRFVFSLSPSATEASPAVASARLLVRVDGRACAYSPLRRVGSSAVIWRGVSEAVGEVTRLASAGEGPFVHSCSSSCSYITISLHASGSSMWAVLALWLGDAASYGRTATSSSDSGECDRALGAGEPDRDVGTMYGVIMYGFISALDEGSVSGTPPGTPRDTYHRQRRQTLPSVRSPTEPVVSAAARGATPTQRAM